MKELLKYKFPIALTLCFTLFSAFMGQGEDKLAWYYDGSVMEWQVQPDVFAFRMKNHGQYEQAYDPQIVEASIFRQHNEDKINLVFFNAASSPTQRRAIIEGITSNAAFEASFPSITMAPEAVYTENLWYFANDKILVKFKNDSIARAYLDDLKLRYALTQVNDLPANGSLDAFTFIFRFQPNELYSNAIILSRTMFVQDSSILSSVEPNLVKVYSQPVISTGGTADIDVREAAFYVVNDHNLNLIICSKKNGLNSIERVTVYDLFGRELYTHPLTTDNERNEVDISNYSSGIYFACLEDVNRKAISTRKFKKF
ncbi:MAG: T9SS type A sorting domain-containing protein [Chitinophagales bacterium]|nr:T9SS type A sorting domain-containing protein [Chitinophagales bacterium]